MTYNASNQNYFADANAPAAWALGIDIRPVKVAVLDTGFFTGNSDLSVPLVAPTRDFYSSADGSTPAPTSGHGTYVASILGAAHNSAGIVGGCRTAQLLLYRVHTDPSVPSWNDIIQALDYAAQAGAKIICCAFGDQAIGSSLHAQLEAKVTELFTTNDCLIVTGVGNSAVEIAPNASYVANTWTLGNCTDVLTVGGLGSDFDTKWYDEPGIGSNYGSRVDICALAKGVYGRWTDSTFTQADGTSGSSAIVAGCAALVRSINPKLTAAQVKALLIDTANNSITANDIGPKVDYLAAAQSALAKKYENQGVILTPSGGSGGTIMRKSGGNWINN